MPRIPASVTTEPDDPATPGRPPARRFGARRFPHGAAPEPGRPTAAAFTRLPMSVLAVTLFAVDALLLIANVVHVRLTDGHGQSRHFLTTAAWNANLDGSHAELFGHLQLLFAGAALVALWHRRGTFVYGAWALVLGAIVADDFLRLHERGGAALVRALHLPAVAGLRPQDLGELSVWGGAALLLGPTLAAAHLSARGTDRRHSRTLLASLAALCTFGAFIDMLHIAIGERIPHLMARALTLTESAGELCVMTVMLLLAHTMIRPAMVRPTAAVIARRSPVRSGARPSRPGPS